MKKQDVREQIGAEINHSEIVRIVSAPLHLNVTTRTLVHGRRLLLIRTIKKTPG